MQVRTTRLLIGSVFMGLAAHLAIVFLTLRDEVGTLFSGASVGFCMAVGTFYLCYGQSPD